MEEEGVHFLGYFPIHPPILCLPSRPTKLPFGLTVATTRAIMPSVPTLGPFHDALGCEQSTMNPTRILVIDDEEGIRNAAQRWLTQEGFEVSSAPDGQAGLELLEALEPEMILCDVRMPNVDGWAVLEAARAHPCRPLCILMSAFGDSDTAIAMIRKGAYDFIPKPFSRGELLLTIQKAQEREHLVRENQALRSVLTQETTYENMVARSDVMHQVFRTIRKVADFKSTVLITGESGTGKELVARALHFQSSRQDKAFVPVNCGAIPEQLLESELFGHAKGAFTDAKRAKTGLFEEASSGTLFLDEITSLPIALQVKLLRVLQEGELRRVGDNRSISINVRIIAAAIDDLGDLVAQGDFREDLYYRLNVIPIHLPPLRERREDIPLLVNHFLTVLNEKLGTKVHDIDHAAMQVLLDYHWPGNVRQLINVLERTVVLCEHERIKTEDLPPKIRGGYASQPCGTSLDNFIAEDDLSIKKATRLLERELILRALRKTQGNRTQAAKVLELSHRALLYKIKDYDVMESLAEDAKKR